VLKGYPDRDSSQGSRTSWGSEGGPGAGLKGWQAGPDAVALSELAQSQSLAREEDSTQSRVWGGLQG
jgi:hypothetical protein